MVDKVRRKQRAAISQAEIRKKCKLLGPIAEGSRAFREGLRRGSNPHHNINNANAWFQGWKLAQDKQRERENG